MLDLNELLQREVSPEVIKKLRPCASVPQKEHLPEWTFTFQVGQEREGLLEIGRGELTILWLDKTTGEILITDGHGEGWSHLNQSLCQFIGCLDAYKQHFMDAQRSHDPTDEECEPLAQQVSEALLSIDPTVFQDEGLWSQAVEEIELGVI